MSESTADNATTEIPIIESTDESNIQKRKLAEVDSIEEEGPDAKKQKIDQPAPQRGLYKRDGAEAPKYLPPLPVANVKKPILLGHHPNNSKKSSSSINNSNSTNEGHSNQKENIQTSLDQNSKISEDLISNKESVQHEEQSQPQQNNQNNMENNNTVVSAKEDAETKSDVHKENSAPIQNQPKPEAAQDSNEEIIKYLPMPIVSFITFYL